MNRELRFQQEDKTIDDNRKIIEKREDKKIDTLTESFKTKIVDRKEIESMLDSRSNKYNTNYDHDLEDTLLSNFRNAIDDKLKENEPHYSVVKKNISLQKNNSTIS